MGIFLFCETEQKAQEKTLQHTGMYYMIKKMFSYSEEERASNKQPIIIGWHRKKKDEIKPLPLSVHQDKFQMD